LEELQEDSFEAEASHTEVVDSPLDFELKTFGCVFSDVVNNYCRGVIVGMLTVTLDQVLKK